MKIAPLYLCCIYLLAPSTVFANENYNFGIVPQQVTSKLVKNWLPLLQHISKNTGLILNFATGNNIPAFEKNLKNELYDFAYMNPYHYVTYEKLSHYHAFAKEANKEIKGILVTKKSNSIKKLTSLSFKTIAFPSPKAFAATLITQAELTKKNINFFPTYVGSHDSVYYHVILGNNLAGGGVHRTLEALKPEIRNQLTIIHTTNGYTPHAFAAHSRVPKKIVDKVRMALEQLSLTNEGNLLLKKLNFNKLQSANDSDWNDVRRLNLK